MKERCFVSLIVIATVIAFPIRSAAQDGLVFYLNFDGTPYTDQSSDPAEVSEEGDILQVPGVFGTSAGEFDGESHIRVEDADKLDGMEQLTLAAWINLADDPDAVGMAIFSKRLSPGKGDVYNLFWFEGTGGMHSRVNSGRGEVEKGGNEISTRELAREEWYHVATLC
jgi:hypothetical protein